MSPVLARRQERAFERLYRKHVGDVYRYALAVLRDPRDAEDVTQTTFMNAYHGFRQGDRALLRLNSLLAIAHDICRRRGGCRRLDEIDLPAKEEALREELDGSLACHQAELAVSRQLDDRLARKEKRRLRAHLRSCEECHAFARSQRTQGAALRALAAVPLPDTLRSFFGSDPRRLALRGGRKFSRSPASP
jgi:DNA-directed RNA polymerase specialized sigma24 family protein